MKGCGVKKARVGRYAVLAATVALALPAVAQAGNEVTNWNQIAMNTVNAQAPITSAPPGANGTTILIGRFG